MTGNPSYNRHTKQRSNALFLLKNTNRYFLYKEQSYIRVTKTTWEGKKRVFLNPKRKDPSLSLVTART
ncbi:MAG TPA: hypothetical protein DCE42_24705 [Myxococcales bacterium]|nr:hypothetical protein [Deltaproteobacteria bacterium]HAA57989.1 hypothetical protein [Myxococcales bacterium]